MNSEGNNSSVIKDEFKIDEEICRMKIGLNKSFDIDVISIW